MSFFCTKILIIILAFSFALNAKVTPPNYDFSFKELEKFFPGKKISDIKLNKELVNKKGKISTYKFYVSQLRYKFPVLIQVNEGIIVDFYATLPTYFLHDVFHQGIIKRLGPQQKYLNQNEHSVYSWENKDGIDYIYSAACTITCFPIFFSGVFSKEKRPKALIPLKDSVLNTELENKTKKP